ncbi:MAG: response regulator [Gemmatimonadetes bacterium]|nr:response regulator [Gemmatimonadota bacterium]
MERPRVLIVEDEFLVAYELRLHLEESGFEVCGMVGTGAEAVAVAERTRPDCVLMDVSLKGDMDGIEAARKVVDRRRVPFVFMTGLPVAQVREQVRELDAAACLSKPVNFAELRRMILELVGAEIWGASPGTETPVTRRSSLG